MLEQIITLLNLGTVSSEMRNRLQVIIDITEQRLKIMLGGIDEVPAALSYIVTEVSIIRFNRIGSEGVSSHSVQGETMNWTDKDFDAYEDDIQAWLNAQTDPSSSDGMVVFI